MIDRLAAYIHHLTSIHPVAIPLFLLCLYAAFQCAWLLRSNSK